MNQVWLINGIPGAGKTITARALAKNLPRAAHIEGDLLQDLIVTGGVWPGQEPQEEADRQLQLNVRNQCSLANSFGQDGFSTVIDYVIVTAGRLVEYRNQIRNAQLLLVTLAPGIEVALKRDALRDKQVAQFWTHLEDEMNRELAGVGLWVNNAQMSIDELVAHILAHTEQARI